jgi:hypothetical protein
MERKRRYRNFGNERCVSISDQCRYVPGHQEDDDVEVNSSQGRNRFYKAVPVKIGTVFLYQLINNIKETAWFCIVLYNLLYSSGN